MCMAEKKPSLCYMGDTGCCNDTEEVSAISAVCWFGSGRHCGPLVTILHSDVSSSTVQPHGNHFYSPCLIKMSDPL